MQKVPRRQPDVCPPQVDAACVCGCSWLLGMPMVKLHAIYREISTRGSREIHWHCMQMYVLEYVHVYTVY